VSGTPGVDWRRVEHWLVLLIAIHSYGVGCALLFVPAFGAALGGWDDVRPYFFMRQAGIFHFLVATVYVVEWSRYRTVSFLLLAKATAVVFLTATWLLASEPWVVPFSGLADGAMGVAVLFVHRRALAGQASRPWARSS